jgi:hypothetical protein
MKSPRSPNRLHNRKMKKLVARREAERSVEELLARPDVLSKLGEAIVRGIARSVTEESIRLLNRLQELRMRKSVQARLIQDVDLLASKTFRKWAKVGHDLARSIQDEQVLVITTDNGDGTFPHSVLK